MKFNLEINKENLVSFYYENKEYIFPILSIVVSILLFFIFLLPQVLSFPSRKSEIDKEMSKLDKIKKTMDANASLNQTQLSSDVRVATQALPNNKAFESILNAISTAANLSSTQLISYDFKDSGSLETQIKSIPSLNFEVSIFGDLAQVVSFVGQLYKTYPISNVSEIKSSEGITTLSVLFYYKAFPEFGIDDVLEVKDRGEEGKKALNEISNWNNPDAQSLIELIPATSSGETRSSPFD